MQEGALTKAHELLGFHARRKSAAAVLNKQDLLNAVEAASDIIPSDAELTEMLRVFGDGQGCLPLANFKTLLQSGKLTPLDTGRYWVAVSLAEAECCPGTIMAVA